jgi:hypothetical protein
VLRRLSPAASDGLIRERLGDGACRRRRSEAAPRARPRARARRSGGPAASAAASAETDAATLGSRGGERSFGAGVVWSGLDEVILDSPAESARQRKRRAQ